MLPNTAMASAPPNSALVSEIADAAPARSGGAEPTTMSVVSVNTGAMPSEKIVEPMANIAKPVDASSAMNIANPMALATRPPAITNAGRIRRTTIGASIEPTTKANAHGSVHNPARNGVSPSTSCRYCGRNRKPPNRNRIDSP